MKRWRVRGLLPHQSPYRNKIPRRFLRPPRRPLRRDEQPQRHTRRPLQGIRLLQRRPLEHPAKLALDNDGIELATSKKPLRKTVQVSPDIFGTLFQHSMDQPERHAYGATTPHPSTS